MDSLIRHKLDNIAIIGHHDAIFRNANNVLGHLGVMLQHVELAVVWHIVLWLHIGHKFNMIFKIGVTREMEWTNVGQMSLAVLNYLSAFAKKPAYG